MKTLYDAHFPNAENRRPGQNLDCPDSDILAIGWLLEYIGADSEHSGYKRLKVELKEVLRVLSQGGRYPILFADKGYNVSQSLERELLDTENMCLLPTHRSNQKSQYPEAFGKLRVRLHRRIETTLNQLKHQFSVARACADALGR